MNESLSGLLQKMTVYDLILTLSFITLIVGILVSQKRKIFKIINRWRIGKNKQEDFNQLVYNLKDSVIGIESTIAQFQLNMDKQSEDILNLTDIIVKMQAKNSKTKRTEIKEKIERIYSECHPAMTCTDMQFETLKELIEEYEEHGGTNSFVHSTVEPEMYTWSKIRQIRSKE